MSLLMSIALVLAVLWVIGWLGFHVLGAFIHILIVLAVIMFIISLFSPRKTAV